MALINCPECNKEISDKAPACPHCGCPLGSETKAAPQEATATPAKNKRPAWLILVLPLAAFLGFFVYCKTIKLHPVITLCESALIESLKSPSSYKPFSREMVIFDHPRLKSEAYVRIEYEAANSYNAKIKGYCKCVMGKPEHKVVGAVEKIFLLQIKTDTLGKSPFTALEIVKINIDGEDVDVPIKVQFHDLLGRNFKLPDFLTPHAPGYIINWIGDGGTDYVVSEKLDEAEIRKNREALENRIEAEKQKEAEAKEREAASTAENAALLADALAGDWTAAVRGQAVNFYINAGSFDFDFSDTIAKNCQVGKKGGYAKDNLKGICGKVKIDTKFGFGPGTYFFVVDGARLAFLKPLKNFNLMGDVIFLNPQEGFDLVIWDEQEQPK